MACFRIPWHNSSPRPGQVLGLVVLPLVTSLLGFCVSLNVLIYVTVNFKQFTDLSGVFSYLAGLSSAVSFVLCVLSIIYGNYVFLIVTTVLQVALSVSLTGIAVDFWTMGDLNADIDHTVFTVFKYTLSAILALMIVLQIRLIVVAIALGTAMYKRGSAWDLDEIKFREDSGGDTVIDID